MSHLIKLEKRLEQRKQDARDSLDERKEDARKKLEERRELARQRAEDKREELRQRADEKRDEIRERADAKHDEIRALPPETTASKSRRLVIEDFPPAYQDLAEIRRPERQAKNGAS